MVERERGRKIVSYPKHGGVAAWFREGRSNPQGIPGNCKNLVQVAIATFVPQRQEIPLPDILFLKTRVPLYTGVYLGGHCLPISVLYSSMYWSPVGDR